ncbi:hypothetical protein Ade02nite_14440 [Paractinoplanes deccanensis]|uniref:Uncharacterized protein n=1 Tax=Paractinoplanes deccanensis TaxID=113561 RepID=A0ABQ3XYH7_9ACTN|nr:hypothetical protein [Actinoplanes deccanensis]GID72803.1 hypothetical protein Ade02nite_14440 [Actinoplanes deccanensis]
MSTDAAPASLDDLLEEVTAFETLEELTREQFERYVEAESTLEQGLLAEATRLLLAVEHDRSVQVLAMVTELNQTLRRIADREAGRDGRTPEDAEYYGWWRSAADGLLLMVEGQRHMTIAEQHRILGDLDTATEHIREGYENFDELSESDHPQAPVGEIRKRIAVSTAQLYESIGHSRIGNYRSAHDLLDSVRVNFDELLAEIAEVDTEGLPALRSVLAELIRDLNGTLVDITALQGVVEMMMAGHAGRFRDMIATGTVALESYQISLNAASASAAGRHVLALRRLEMGTISFWVNYAEAEIAVDDGKWDRAGEFVRKARRHLMEINRLGVRNQEVGLTAQRPDISTLEFMLAGVDRRAERERRLREDIHELRASLHRAQLSNINVYNSAEARQGATTMGDSFVFNAPVQSNGNMGGTGNQSTVHQAAQDAGGTAELRRLADQLAQLRAVLEAGPRTTVEQESIDQVRQAEEAARAGDESTARGHLAGVGRWVLGVAERIGVELATTALRASIGA